MFELTPSDFCYLSGPLVHMGEGDCIYMLQSLLALDIHFPINDTSILHPTWYVAL